MCSILDNVYLALSRRGAGTTYKASTRREVIVNIVCLLLVMRYG